MQDIHGHLNFDEMSRYYEIKSYDEIPKDNIKYLRIIHLNARGLTQSKLTSFVALLNSLTHKPDIICFTESWVNSSNNKLALASYGSITILELSYYPPPSPR